MPRFAGLWDGYYAKCEKADIAKAVEGHQAKVVAALIDAAEPHHKSEYQEKVKGLLNQPVDQWIRSFRRGVSTG